ncbi:MAG TPA: hypothetical protein VK302_08750 [Terriglobales bacterium]|nr:hypothetical protein [Terriglobales bacterium]
MQFLRKICTDDQGQDIAEYADMLAVILVIVIGTVRLIGGNANNAFSSVASNSRQHLIDQRCSSWSWARLRVVYGCGRSRYADFFASRQNSITFPGCDCDGTDATFLRKFIGM